MDLPDSDIYEIAAAWKKLHNLRLQGRALSALSPHACLRLADLCPELQEIYLEMLDISDASTFSFPPNRIPHNLAKLDVSSLVDSNAGVADKRKALAHVLYAIFPNIWDLKGCSPWSDLSSVMGDYAENFGAPIC